MSWLWNFKEDNIALGYYLVYDKGWTNNQEDRAEGKHEVQFAASYVWERMGYEEFGGFSQILGL